MQQHVHDSSKMLPVASEPLDYAELKAEKNELREAVKNFETELMQVEILQTIVLYVLQLHHVITDSIGCPRSC